MAMQKREYIFGASVSSVLSVLLIIIAAATDSWIDSTFIEEGISTDTIWYGLFRGQTIERVLTTPTTNTLYMTCVADVNACAISCKSNAQARETEVRALAQGFRPSVDCSAITTVNETDPLEQPPVISLVFYAFLLAVLFLEMLSAIAAASLAILNVIANPTEPMFGLPGVLWTNIVTAVLGFLSIMMFGIYWASSGLNGHLAFSMIVLGNYELMPALGYSYWILIIPVLLSLCNVGLLELRRYFLERDPTPTTIKLDNHSDGTIFLY